MGLEGTWYNELGSTLEISPQQDGTVQGRYSSNVASCGWYPIGGMWDPSPGPGQNCGWVVDWNSGECPAGTLTSWSGQYWAADGQYQETIVTMWHLTYEVPQSSQWQSTLDGKDVFTRNQPSPEEIKAARRHVAPSHPHEQQAG